MLEHNISVFQEQLDVVGHCELSIHIQNISATLLQIFALSYHFGSLKDKYIHTRIKQIIQCRSIDAFQSILNSILQQEGTKIANKLINRYLFYALKHASSSFFLAVFKNIQINGKKPVYAASSLIKSIEYLCSKNDNEAVLALLSSLISKFRHVDPEHVTKIEEALMNNQKLSTGNDIFYHIQRETKKLNSSTRILLGLLKPNEKKIIVPEVRIADPADESKCVLQYYDNKHKQHEITLLRDAITNEYIYGDYRTDNIYEMIVSTQIGEEIFGSFPHQLVAVTKEVSVLPLEDQPWFFGHLNKEQLSELLDYTAGATLFITVSHGSKISLYWSGTKHGVPHQSCATTQIISRLEEKLSCQAFVAGIYNNGVVNKRIYQFYCLVVKGDLTRIKKHHSEHNIDLSQLTEPNILGDYLQAVQRPDDKVIDWLIENGCTGVEKDEIDDTQCKGHPYLLATVLKKCKLSVVKTLLDRGATIAIDTLGALFQTVHKFDKPSHTKKTLVICAWQFGNKKNYFKMLPKEIIKEVISYGLDDPEWFAVADRIVESYQHNFYLNGYQELADNFHLFAPYIVKSHRKLNADFLSQLFNCVCLQYQFNYVQQTAYWITKISEVVPKIPPLNMTFIPNLLYYCLENARGQPILKALMDSGYITKEVMSDSDTKRWYSMNVPGDIPPAWIAPFSRNKAAVKFLCSVGAMPMSTPKLTLERFLQVQHVKEDMYELVVECVALKKE